LNAIGVSQRRGQPAIAHTKMNDDTALSFCGIQNFSRPLAGLRRLLSRSRKGDEGDVKYRQAGGG
jgi:hypothetical protein